MRVKQFLFVPFLMMAFAFVNAQTKNNYTSQWKKIDSLINQRGLTRSALAEVNKIYTAAKKEQNDAQVIKALVYTLDLQQSLQENASASNISTLEKEIASATQPAKSILQSVLAEMYSMFYRQNYWKLRNRTNTAGFKKDDVATWTADDFHQRIAELYLASISSETILQQTSLESFDAIIRKGNVRYLRPTLYDLLAHEALDYFKSGERDITKPVQPFEMNQAVAFAEAERFSSFKFTTTDSFSLHFKALQVFQRLIRFHLQDANPAALIDVDVDRVQFAYLNTVMEEDDKLFLYRNSLKRIAQKYAANKESDGALYLLAQTYAQEASEYDALKDTTGRYGYVTAKKLCEQILQRNEPSQAKTEAANLLNTITQKEVHTEAERVNLPGQPFRMLVKYRNFTQLHVRIVKFNKATREKLGTDYWEDAYWKAVLSMQPVKTFTQTLPTAGDYQNHSTEIKIDALPVGDYVLVASTDNSFALNKHPMAMQMFHVSAISWINNQSDYFALHRETGQPLANADVQVWLSSYDYNTRNWQNEKYKQLKTDKNGFFKIEITQRANIRDVNLEVTTATDHLYLQDNVYSFYHLPYPESKPDLDKKTFEENHRSTDLFTDRSIYRPGQVIYFKGIVITEDFNTRKPKIFPGLTTKVYLRNLNRENIDSIEVTTNEFGSYSGKFRAPENRLTGTFLIADKNSEAFFAIEEYKRPKFFVEVQNPAGSYRLNDTIEVNGFAKAYAGNNIDGSTVKYRVVRNARFPYPWLFWKWRYPVVPPQEIAHGVVTSGADGKFNFKFAATPDKTIRKEFDPIFTYEITVDVTDINGETRTGSSSVNVSYKALQLSVVVPGGETMPVDSLKTIVVNTTNLAGEFVPALVNVSVYKLNAPQRLIRERLWPQPDTFVMSKAEYLQYFPYDEYSNESQKENWERAGKVFDKSDSTKPQTTNIKLQTSLLAGWYAIEVSTRDKHGETVKDVRYIQLLQSNGQSVTPLYKYQTPATQVKEPGETAKVSIGNTVNDVFVIQHLDKGIARPGAVSANEGSSFNFFILNNETKHFNFPITEADRGGFSVWHAFVKHNRFFVSSSQVVVPWSNKDLNITYETFRDKTLPGSQEKWKIKLAGNKNEKVAAEMLTAMYDASLDQFKMHQWSKPSIWPTHIHFNRWNAINSFAAVASIEKFYSSETVELIIKQYDQLLKRADGAVAEMRMAGKAANRREVAAAAAPPSMKNAMADRSEDISDQLMSTTGSSMATTEEGKPKVADAVQVRKNFNETAFFFPDLKTDSAGNIEFSFTLPEALTQWKWMTLAHTKELEMSYSEKTIVTQKELMVQPNIPRFVREGDRMDLSAKIVNMSDKELSGQIELQLRDATTNQSIDGWFQNMFPNQYFTVAAGQSTVINFTIQPPYQFNKPMVIRFIARAGNVSDGEENSIPVLTNRILVTESIPLNVRGSGVKNFNFEKLSNSGQSETLSHQSLTVEFTGNPAWYAVQALPYLMEYPYECSEQVWNRVYANALAAKIANASPRIKAIFEKWKSSDTSALLSNLQKNEELKSVLLQETPWVLQAKNETEQKKRIALLFDMVKLSQELDKNLDQLMQLQSSNGGFVWFKGGRDDRYITQYILAGIGHLKKLNAIPASLQKKINTIVQQAIPYLDKRIKEDYDNLIKYKADLTKDQIGYIQAHYLYMRSFFNDINASGSTAQPFNFYRKQSQQFWVKKSRYVQGMMALSLYRTGDGKTATDILRSLKQNAIVNEELGMYWKDMSGGYYWYQAPIETQALLMEAFNEITKDYTTVDNLRTWLLKNKQTNNWHTTKATADACYALLLQGTDWLSSEPVVQVKLGDKTISSLDQKTEAGSGYFKKVFDAPFVNNSMGNISVSVTQPNNAATGKPASQTSWGAVYWQYFENLENITPATTPLKLSKKLFIERNTDRGPVLEPVEDNGIVKVGDKIKVRIELRVDRDMEYVHMKDMRASAMEPVNVLSSYKWQGGLGYYESTRDASTNFFFDYLPKGTYVFEYPLFVTHTGTFSNGITSIQCMYAPEFSSHSEGIKINVE